MESNYRCSYSATQRDIHNHMDIVKGMLCLYLNADASSISITHRHYVPQSANPADERVASACECR